MMETAAARESRAYRLRWWILAVLSLSVIIIVIDNSVLNVALPTMQRELDATGSELQWMVNGYILVLASLLLIMGSLADRLGRAKVLRAGMIIFAGGSLWAMTADSPNVVIAARAIMGIGAACIMPATLAIIMHVFPREERGKAIGVWASLAGVGIALGPITGGLLIEHFSWSAIFFINIPIAVVALTAGAFLVPNSRNPNPQRLDLLGALLSAGALGLLVYGLIKGGEVGWTHGIVLGCFLGAIAVGALFVLWERRTTAPMLDMRLFRNLRFAAGTGGIATMMLANFGVLFGLTLYLQFVLGYSALETGIRFLPMAAGFAIGSGTSHRRVALFGTKYVVAGGFVGIAAVLAGMAFWGVDTPYWILGPMFFALAFCMGNTMAANVDSITGAVPLAQAGVGGAAPGVSAQVGGSIGVAALGSVLSSVYMSNIKPLLAGLPGLPEHVIDAAKDSVGSAMVVAEQLPPAIAETLRTAARNSFMDGWQLLALIGCAIAAFGAIMVFRFMPARPIETVSED